MELICKTISSQTSNRTIPYAILVKNIGVLVLLMAQIFTLKQQKGAPLHTYNDWIIPYPFSMKQHSMKFNFSQLHNTSKSGHQFNKHMVRVNSRDILIDRCSQYSTSHIVKMSHIGRGIRILSPQTLDKDPLMSQPLGLNQAQVSYLNMVSKQTEVLRLNLTATQKNILHVLGP